MEQLSVKCRIILVSALACLILGIAMAPAGPTIPFSTVLDEHLEYPSKAPSLKQGVSAQATGTPLNCTGGNSVNCHISGNQSGL